MKYLAVCEYDGKNYSGFQYQKNAPSIQAEIEHAINQVGPLKRRINCSGRTDGGVHAFAQIIDFESDAERDNKNWLNGINSNLPNDIALKDIRIVDESFHARFSAVNRRYLYCIDNNLVHRPLQANRHAWIEESLDIDLISEEAKALKGEQDFSSFRSSECSAKSPVKNIEDFEVITDQGFVYFQITASAFLHNMVRIIAGTLIKIGLKQSKMSLLDIIKGRDRNLAGPTAKASGLMFLGARYSGITQTQFSFKDIGK